MGVQFWGRTLNRSVPRSLPSCVALSLLVASQPFEANASQAPAIAPGFSFLEFAPGHVRHARSFSKAAVGARRILSVLINERYA